MANPPGLVPPRIAHELSQVPSEGWELADSVTGPIEGAKEPVGAAFHAKCREAVGADPAIIQDESEPEETSEDSSTSLAGFVDPTKDKRRQKASKGKKGRLDKDYYGYLGLGNERWQAKQKDIERAYKTIALKFHPDKCVGAGARSEEREQVEERFKLIYEAYEVLSDPRKRREYDSIDAGDDDLPMSCPEGKFFDVFGPAVRRLSRWSARQPVPLLGDEDTPWGEVERFYRFWHQFKSWREFPQDDEYDIEEAEGREERRWMQRENEKMRKKAKQEEAARIRSFVEAMENQDPRIQAMKEAERRKRQEKKEARRMARQSQFSQGGGDQSPSSSSESSGSQGKGQEEPSHEAKKQRERDRKALQKERQRLRQAAATPYSSHAPGRTAVEALCSRLSLTSIRMLNERLGKEEDLGNVAEIIKQEYVQLTGDNSVLSDERQSQGAGNDDLNQSADGDDEREEEGDGESDQGKELENWSREAELALVKALKAFPKSSASEKDRWRKIAEAVPNKGPSECYRYYHFKIKERLAKKKEQHKQQGERGDSEEVDA